MKKDVYFGLINLLLLLDMTNFTFVVPIIPDFLLKRDVSLSLIGLILSFFQISFFFTSLFMSKTLVLYNKNHVMLFGQILLIITNFTFAFLDNDISYLTIIILSSLLRFSQGAALALVVLVSYSNFPLLYKNNLDQKYAIGEISISFGFTIGPIIGGFLYEYLEYIWCFHIMSLIYTITAIILFPFFLSHKFDLEENMGKENETSENHPHKQINYCQILKNRKFILTFGVFMFNYISYFLIQPGFSDHIHSYGASEDIVGMIFGITSLVYGLTGFFVLFSLSKITLERKYCYIVGGITAVISLFLSGPEDYTYLPKNLIVVCVGMGILGFSQMCYIFVLIPDYLDIFKEIDPNAQGSPELATGLFNASVALSEFLGAILGGVLSDYFGFSRGMAIYAIFLFGFIIIFAIFRKKITVNNDLIAIDNTLCEKRNKNTLTGSQENENVKEINDEEDANETSLSLKEKKTFEK